MKGESNSWNVFTPGEWRPCSQCKISLGQLFSQKIEMHSRSSGSRYSFSNSTHTSTRLHQDPFISPGSDHQRRLVTTSVRSPKVYLEAADPPASFPLFQPVWLVHGIVSARLYRVKRSPQTCQKWAASLFEAFPQSYTNDSLDVSSSTHVHRRDIVLRQFVTRSLCLVTGYSARVCDRCSLKRVLVITWHAQGLQQCRSWVVGNKPGIPRRVIVGCRLGLGLELLKAHLRADQRTWKLLGAHEGGRERSQGLPSGLRVALGYRVLLWHSCHILWYIVAH